MELRSREQWERWYAHANPWGTEGDDDDLVREALLLERIRYARFTNLLDLGCGEGRLTSALAALSDRTLGIDISERALQRARSRYPHIEFRQGDLPEALAQPQIAATPFDFVSVAEVLYYFQTDEERDEMISAVARIGAPGCLYYFSVLLAAAKQRRYFTFEEFISNVSAHFNVIDVFASVAHMPPALDALRRLLPAHARLAMLRNWAATRKVQNCRHLGCFAVKRDGRPSPFTAH